MNDDVSVRISATRHLQPRTWLMARQTVLPKVAGVLPPLSSFGTFIPLADDLEARFSRIGESAGCVSIERAGPVYHEAWFCRLSKA